MTTSEMMIQSLWEQNAGAVEMAEAVSCAVRIEPFLLRCMRLGLPLSADSGAEADVWLSPLVQVRGPEGVVFHPDVAEALRKRLRDRSPETLKRSWELLRDFHKHLPFAIQCEEEIAFWSAYPSPEATKKIDDLLKSAAKTLATSYTRQGLTNWAARALPRMPCWVRDLEGARMLALASYVRLTRNLPVGDVNPKQPFPPWVSWILPSDLENTNVRVRLVQEGIELSLGETGNNTISVPDVQPCLIEISWKTEDGREEVQQVSLQRGERSVVQSPTHEFDIRTLVGKRYRLAEKKPMPEEGKVPEIQKTCFVVMGFGKKTDYPTGRVLDLDKTYMNVIKPAAEQAGLQCLRADEIVGSGAIDVLEYEWLLKADIVVADVSTNNANAFYELGVRHALRPSATIVIAEDKMVFPFGINHIAVRKYQHLGDGIDFDEVMRIQGDLKSAFQAVAHSTVPDSPVYRFLGELHPPYWGDSPRRQVAPPNPLPSESQSRNPTIATLMSQADEASKNSDFLTAKALLTVVLSIMPNDTYAAQKLALATYKSKQPNQLQALKDAYGILVSLSPETSSDTETLGLYGKVNRHLWEETGDKSYLNTAIWAHEKGFYLKNDYFNGINLAYMLNARTTLQADADVTEAVADFVLARRVRQRVAQICVALLEKEPSREEEYWIRASLAEAWLGLGERKKSSQESSRAFSVATAKWMLDTTNEQFKRLELLLADSPLDRISLRGPRSGPATATAR
jgi:hypothetical protein